MISKRRFGEAIVQFKKIAKINGRNFDVTEKELAEIYTEDKHEVTYGIASLFAGWRLARNTIIMGFSWCVRQTQKKAICISNCGGFLSFTGASLPSPTSRWCCSARAWRGIRF